jgi:ribosomal protein L7Ae-like RNA K-turn-binding protein
MPAPDRAIGLLGMAARAGRLAAGTTRVREAARTGSLHFAVLAVDASDNSRGKLQPLLDALGITYMTRYDRVTLGGAVGRGPLSAVGVTDAALAEKLAVLLRGSASQ